MEIVEQNQYREELLEWCNNLYFHWERMKPRFSKLFDRKSLEEWEESCHELTAKLQTKVDFDEYYTAKNLFDQWELLYDESKNYREEFESDVWETVELSSESDWGIGMPGQENDTVKELNKDWIELIQMAVNLEIPIQDIRKILLDYKG